MARRSVAIRAASRGLESAASVVRSGVGMLLVQYADTACFAFPARPPNIHNGGPFGVRHLASRASFLGRGESPPDATKDPTTAELPGYAPAAWPAVRAA